MSDAIKKNCPSCFILHTPDKCPSLKKARGWQEPFGTVPVAPVAAAACPSMNFRGEKVLSPSPELDAFFAHAAGIDMNFDRADPGSRKTPTTWDDTNADPPLVIKEQIRFDPLTFVGKPFGEPRLPSSQELDTFFAVVERMTARPLVEPRPQYTARRTTGEVSGNPHTDDWEDDLRAKQDKMELIQLLDIDECSNVCKVAGWQPVDAAHVLHKFQRRVKKTTRR